jgi:hypothetical protein
MKVYCRLSKHVILSGVQAHEEKAVRSPVPIVVVDSGIDRTVADLDRYVVHETGYTLTEDGAIVEDRLPVRHEHGTMVALVIRQMCQQVAITSVNILDERLRGDGRILIHALDQAIERHPKIIHLSLGTSRFRYRFALKRLVNKARKLNIAVVAADSNDSKNVYPASLRHVVGVRADSCSKTTSYGYKKKYFYGPPDLGHVHGIENLEHPSVRGNSVAAAYLTGHLSKILYDKAGALSFTELINALREGANVL